MIADRETLRWLWPRYEIVFPLDLLVSLVILGAIAAAAMLSYAPLTMKARASEILLAFGPAKGDLVERLAITGDPVELPLAEAGSVAAVSIEAQLSGGRRSPSRGPAGAGIPEGPAAQRDDPAGRGLSQVQVRMEGNTLVASARLLNQSYTLSMYPATADEETPKTYLWLCGRTRPAEGLLAQPPAVATDLPDNALPPDCRRPRRTS